MEILLSALIAVSVTAALMTSVVVIVGGAPLPPTRRQLATVRALWYSSGVLAAVALLFAIR